LDRTSPVYRNGWIGTSSVSINGKISNLTAYGNGEAQSSPLMKTVKLDETDAAKPADQPNSEVLPLIETA